MMKDHQYLTAVLCLSALALPLGAAAQASACEQPPSPLEEPLSDSTLPPVYSAGSIRYMSGGIGSDETAAMRSQKLKYPLALTFAEGGPRSGFLASVLVSISNASGTQLLCLVTRGPLLYVDLPAGTYKVAATARERGTLERKLTIAPGGRADAVMVWPPLPQRQYPIRPPLPPQTIVVPRTVPPVQAPAPDPAAVPAPLPNDVPPEPAAPSAPVAPMAPPEN